MGRKETNSSLEALDDDEKSLISLFFTWIVFFFLGGGGATKDKMQQKHTKAYKSNTFKTSMPNFEKTEILQNA